MYERKRGEEENENLDRWLVSYADFITLMFAFFTIMYATSTKDFEQAKKFEDSVRKAFLAVAQFGKAAGPGEYSHPEDADSPIPPPIEVFQRPNTGVAELADALQRWLDEKITAAERKEMKLQIIEDPYGVRVSFDSEKIFEPQGVNLRPEGAKLIDRLAVILKDSGKDMLVEGHTDNTKPVSKIYQSNWELAGARAGSIVEYLIKNHKIRPARLVAISMADQRPVATNDTAEGREKNRRIEVLLTTKKTGVN